MDMKYMIVKFLIQFIVVFKPANTIIINNYHYKGENKMLKLLAKIAEKYAKSTNTACLAFGIFHQPKMPASLIKKD